MYVRIIFVELKSNLKSSFGDGALMRHWRVLPVTPRPPNKILKILTLILSF